MDYREHSGVKISEIGIGSYAMSGVYGQKDGQNFRRVIERAYELGVIFFDTAEAYGAGEQGLGEAVKPFRKEILLSTKVGVKKGAKPNLSVHYIKTACRESLHALQTDYIDVYHVHYDDPQWEVEEVVGALDELVKEGLIRFYGLDHISLERLPVYLEKGRIFSILVELSPVERNSLKEILPVCRKENVAGIAFSVTGRGLLSGRFNSGKQFPENDFRRSDPLFQRERLQSGLRIAGRLAEIGRKYGKSPVQTAIAWVLHQPGISCALTGPSSINHLEENLGGSGWRFESDHLENLEQFLDQEQAIVEKEQRLSLRNILTNDLNPEASQAFTDLVYVLETAYGLGMASEAEVMPLFYELIGLRAGLAEPETWKKLSLLQGEIKETIKERGEYQHG